MEVLDVLRGAEALLVRGWSPLEAEREVHNPLLAERNKAEGTPNASATSWVRCRWDHPKATRFSLSSALRRAGQGDHLARKLAQIAVAKLALERYEYAPQERMWADDVLEWFDNHCQSQGQALSLIRRAIDRETPTEVLLDDHIPY